MLSKAAAGISHRTMGKGIRTPAPTATTITRPDGMFEDAALFTIAIVSCSTILSLECEISGL